MRKVEFSAGEFAVVVTAAFGWFVAGSLMFFVRHRPQTHTNATLLALAVYEAGMMLLLGYVLHRRGWSLEKIGLVPGWKDTAIGLGLAVVAFLVPVYAWYLFAAAAPDLARSAAATPFMRPGLSPGVLAAVVLVNPLYEEVFVTGYVMTALEEKHGPAKALNASVAIRLVYHLYQGVRAVITIIPVGLIFGHWYGRTKRLWPLVVAHAVMDFVALSYFLGR
ncbi:MAG: CPBP family intramembrane metalloprotease [Alphaproteobacteria bacterium]|nr:CPBP family intramembrane metalloprotease [Alphaproteobacteria bacterium]